MPKLAGEIEDYIFFISKKSGGKDGDLLWPYVWFHRLFVKSSLRELPGDVYVAAAKVQEPFLAYALLKLAHTAGPNQE